MNAAKTISPMTAGSFIGAGIVIAAVIIGITLVVRDAPVETTRYQEIELPAEYWVVEDGKLRHVERCASGAGINCTASWPVEVSDIEDRLDGVIFRDNIVNAPLPPPTIPPNFWEIEEPYTSYMQIDPDITKKIDAIDERVTNINMLLSYTDGQGLMIPKILEQIEDIKTVLLAHLGHIPTGTVGDTRIITTPEVP